MSILTGWALTHWEIIFKSFNNADKPLSWWYWWNVLYIYLFFLEKPFWFIIYCNHLYFVGMLLIHPSQPNFLPLWILLTSALDSFTDTADPACWLKLWHELCHMICVLYRCSIFCYLKPLAVWFPWRLSVVRGPIFGPLERFRTALVNNSRMAWFIFIFLTSLMHIQRRC